MNLFGILGFRSSCDESDLLPTFDEIFFFLLPLYFALLLLCFLFEESNFISTPIIQTLCGESRKCEQTMSLLVLCMSDKICKKTQSKWNRNTYGNLFRCGNLTSFLFLFSYSNPSRWAHTWMRAVCFRSFAHKTKSEWKRGKQIKHIIWMRTQYGSEASANVFTANGAAMVHCGNRWQ